MKHPAKLIESYATFLPIKHALIERDLLSRVLIKTCFIISYAHTRPVEEGRVIVQFLQTPR